MYVNIWDILLLGTALLTFAAVCFLFGYKMAEDTNTRAAKAAKDAIEKYQQVMHDNYYLAQSQQRWNTHYSSEKSDNVYSLSNYPKAEQS